MRKMNKKVFAMTLAFAMTVASFATPVVAGAATNINKSVDSLKNGGIDTLYTLPSKKAELTIGVKGQYQLRLKQIGLSAQAKEAGFEIVDDQTVSYTDVDGRKTTHKVVWSTAKSDYVSTTNAGLITANKVCKTKADGSYYRVSVTASIPDLAYAYNSNTAYTFNDGVIVKTLVTVVPESDLSVYYYGVWSESDSDNDAQHITDYAVSESNVKSQLKNMSEAVAGHCVSTSSKVVAFTKTNDGKVRAYLKCTSKEAGSHYYILTYSTDEKVNKITVAERDYCDTEYTHAGTYYRDAK
jgi:hypothetical protein